MPWNRASQLATSRDQFKWKWNYTVPLNTDLICEHNPFINCSSIRLIIQMCMRIYGLLFRAVILFLDFPLTPCMSKLTLFRDRLTEVWIKPIQFKWQVNEFKIFKIKRFDSHPLVMLHGSHFGISRTITIENANPFLVDFYPSPPPFLTGLWSENNPHHLSSEFPFQFFLPSIISSHHFCYTLII